MRANQTERASAVRQLADTARDLVNEARTLVERADRAQDGSEEKIRLEERARESLTKAKTIAQSAIKLGK